MCVSVRCCCIYAQWYLFQQEIQCRQRDRLKPSVRLKHGLWDYSYNQQLLHSFCCYLTRLTVQQWQCAFNMMQHLCKRVGKDTNDLYSVQLHLQKEGWKVMAWRMENRGGAQSQRGVSFRWKVVKGWIKRQEREAEESVEMATEGKADEENWVGKDKGRRDGTWESGLFRPLLMLPETQREECGLFLGPALRFSMTLRASKHSSGRV